MTKIYPPTGGAYRKININRCWMKEDYIERALRATFISLLYDYVTETYTLDRGKRKRKSVLFEFVFEAACLA